ncbi:hypothetical protein DSO57_1012369 [Entomophthora muscae]|uniref:Uncharacterized protein n=1 Tax=Entomophthora muscae TaxID=34485 RepID=A0ACC2TGZ6_9FUNG|nr:hypothetical protein DSO57_1012369 [Entomophthora muscae]
MGKKAPNFIAKLYVIVSDKASDHIISWTPCLTQVLVHNILEFERSILVGNFKNKDFRSFFRQLALYKFIRTSDGRKTRGKGLDTYCLFHHKFFNPLRPADINLIQRCSNYSYIPVSRRIRAVLSDLPSSRQQSAVPEYQGYQENIYASTLLF